MFVGNVGELFECCPPSWWRLWPSITSETSLIVKAIQKNDFLSRLDDEQTAMMVDLLAVSNLKLGEEVIKEGTEGNSMYIVAGGDMSDSRWMRKSCSVIFDIKTLYLKINITGTKYIENSKNFFLFCVLAGELVVTQAGRELRTLTSGDVFGELAILYNCKRTATVKGQSL